MTRGSAGAALAVGLAVGLATATGPAAASAPAASASGASPSTAVVALAGRGPVVAPGVAVTAYLPAVGAEVVRGTRAGLAALARDRRVVGLRGDAPVRTAGEDFAAGADAVFGWQGLGSTAGRPDAGRGATVAIVDTGVSDTAVLDRASGRLVDGVDTSPLTTGGDARTAGTFSDGFGHGTFLATLLAGGSVQGGGRAVGVAPGARVVVVKVADSSGITSLSAVLAGLDWVATHRPIDVVSLALAADPPDAGYGPDPLTMAVQHLRRAGLTVVVAAGNTPGRLGDPGDDPRALTVGAADLTADRATVAPFSGSGTVAGVAKPDVVASGVHLLGLVPADSWVARTYPQAQRPDGFWRGSGTSEATAVAAGAAAIYLGDHPDASPAAVKALLRGAARPLADVAAGAGLLQVPTGSETPDNGEGGFDQATWWAASWDAPGWLDQLDQMWSTGVWDARTWSSDPWSGDGWSARTWSARTWSARTWSARTWSARTWSARTWSARTWSSAWTDDASDGTDPR